MATSRSHRLIAAVVLIAVSGVLAGCSSSSFDPTDMFDVFDTKKKLPGNREPVFPGGVPGLEQGVPKELYKDNVDRQQLQQQEAAPVETATPPAAEPPKPRASSRSRAAKHRAVAPAHEDTAAPEQQGAATAPAPKPAKRTVRHRSTTVPPPDSETPAPQAQPQAAPPAASGNSFPAPLPSGSFQR